MNDVFVPDIVSSTLKRVALPEPVIISDDAFTPREGDVVAVEVVNVGGGYDTVEDLEGRPHTLHQGMKLLGVIGSRQAVQGFVGRVPETVEAGDTLQFIGGGGVIAEGIDYFEEVGRPWDVEVKGVVVDAGSVLNVADFSIPWKNRLEDCPPIVLVAGTRMDSGKTTLAANLIQKLDRQGLRVGAAKLTGFTRQRDRLKMREYGAVQSLDFVDAGILHTMTDADTVIKAAKTVLSEFESGAVDVVVVELGGGLIGPDHVFEVVTEPEIVEHTVFLIVTAMDPVAAYGAVQMLEEKGVVPHLISGPATDTETGKTKIQDHTDVPALNGRKEAQAIAEQVVNMLGRD